MAHFEWDHAKGAANYLKHGVRFETAREVFEDPLGLEWMDDRFDYGEERFNIVGNVRGRLLFVSYTTRNDVIRIVSARGAEPHERRKYHEESQ